MVSILHKHNALIVDSLYIKFCQHNILNTAVEEEIDVTAVGIIDIEVLIRISDVVIIVVGIIEFTVVDITDVILEEMTDIMAVDITEITMMTRYK